MFFAILLPAWVVMNLYIGWRAASVPLVARHVPRWLLAALVTLLAISYVPRRLAGRQGPVRSGSPQAAAAGVGLMLAAHTHDGQIWPFRYVIRLQFPFLAGRYEVGRMTLLVCRGTGTFGPRMRLWYPSEILRITLRPLPG